MIRNILLFFVFSLSFHAQAYTDKIWLKSPTTIKTVYDVKVHAIFRNLYDNQILIDPSELSWQKAHLAAERKSLLEQTVVNQYLQDNRIQYEMKRNEIKNAKKRIQSPLSSTPNKNSIFEKWTIQQADIDRWLKERILLEKFLQNHQPFQAIVTERKVQQYYEENNEKRFLNRPLQDLYDLVKEDYKKAYLQTEFNKWLDQEIRRQKWIVHQ